MCCSTYELEEETQLEVERWADYLRSQAWAYGYCGDDLVLVLSKNDAKVSQESRASLRASLL